MKKIVPVLMILLAAASIAAVYLWQELSEVRKQTTELTEHVNELQTAQLAAAATPNVLPAPTLPVQAGTASPAAIPAQPAAGQPAAAATGEKKPESGIAALAQQILGTPEGREMVNAQMRAMMPQQYPDVGKELGLTPAETEKLFDMLAKHQASQTGDGLALLGGGQLDAAAIQEMRRKSQETQKANQAELAALLGDKSPKWQTYQQTLPMRRQVNQLQSALGTGNNALSDAQVKPLITALAAEQTRIQQERRAAPRQPQQGTADPMAAMEQQIQRTAEANSRMVNAAASHLNPQQLEGYKRMLEQQQSLEQTLMRSIGSQLPAQTNGK